MSHSGWSSTNYISAIGGATPTAVPLTFHARYKTASFAATARLVAIYFASTGYGFRLQVSSGQKLTAQTQDAGGLRNAVGATSIGTDWVSAVATFASATDRKVYLNGTQDASNTTSATPTGTTISGNVGYSGGFPALGSVAEAAIWNVALSAEDIAALNNVSPLLIRPDALVAYIPLLDSGTLDLVAPAATVTGTLTKDNDHPSVIYPRRKALWVPKVISGGAGAIEGTASQTLAAFTQSSASKLKIKANGNKTLAAFTQSSASKLLLKSSAAQTLAALTNATTTSKLIIKGQA